MRYFPIFYLLLAIFFTGCYTKFASMEQILPAEKIETIIDSTGDTVKVIKHTDTIINREKETCIWERDIFGRPYLRCYDSYYPRDWFLYNNSPWWYRNDPFWYDYDRCPRYYRYDPSCDCCRYTYRRQDYYRNDYNRPNRSDNSSNSTGTSNTSGSNSVNSSTSAHQDNVKSRSTGTKVPVQNPQSVKQEGVSKTANPEVSDTLPQPQKEINSPSASTDSLSVKKREVRSRGSR